jgi:hypothetical protein
VCDLIWEDLQTTEVQDAWVFPDPQRIKYVLMVIHHLKLYPKEYEYEATWDMSEIWGRDWVWYFVEKIQVLKEDKITWPEPEEYGKDIWILLDPGAVTSNLVTGQGLLLSQVWGSRHQLQAWNFTY